MPESGSHWHVLGAGSIGCLWGAHLALSGCAVTLLLRGTKATEALARDGGILLTEGHQQHLVTVKGESVTAKAEPCANVLVTTKAHQTMDALGAISSRIVTGTCLLLLQNGMGMAQQIAEAYPHATLLVGSTTEGAWRRDRFHVVHAGRGTTWLGSGHSPIGDEIRERMVSEFARTDLEASWDHNIGLRLWRKLAINCAINPLTALCNCRNGELPRGRRSRHLLEEVCREIDQVLACEGIALGQSTLDLAVEVAQATASNRSSMLQDLSDGQRTEIDWINGYLVSRAAEHGIQVPLNRFLVDLVLAAESVRDKPGGSR